MQCGLRSPIKLLSMLWLVTGCGAHFQSNRSVTSNQRGLQTEQTDVSGSHSSSNANPNSPVETPPVILGLLPESIYERTLDQGLQELINNGKVTLPIKDVIKIELKTQGGTVEKGLFYPASPLTCKDVTKLSPSLWNTTQHERLLQNLQAKLAQKGVTVLTMDATQSATSLTLWITPQLVSADCKTNQSQSLGPWNEGNLIAQHHAFLVTQDHSEALVLHEATSLALAAIGRANTEALNLAPPTANLVVPSTDNFLQLARLTPQLSLMASLTSLGMPSTVKRWFEEREALPYGENLRRGQVLPSLIAINYLGLQTSPKTSESSWALLSDQKVMTTISSQIGPLAQDWLDRPFGGILQSLTFPLKLDSLSDAMGKDPSQTLPPQFLSQAMSLPSLASQKQRLQTLMTLSEAITKLKKENEQQAARQLLLWLILDADALQAQP